MKNNNEDQSDQTSATSSHGVTYDPMDATSSQQYDEPMEHMEIEHGQPTELIRMTSKSKEGLRKGKWTVRYLLYR